MDLTCVFGWRLDARRRINRTKRGSALLASTAWSIKVSSNILVLISPISVPFGTECSDNIFRFLFLLICKDEYCCDDNLAVVGKLLFIEKLYSNSSAFWRQFLLEKGPNKAISHDSNLQNMKWARTRKTLAILCF